MGRRFKIGVMTDSFKLPFGEALCKAAEVGAQGIQLYVVEGEMIYSSFDQNKIDRVKSLLAEKNLVIAALCGDFGGHGFSTETENEWKIPASKKVAELAVKLGTTVVTTHAGVVPENECSVGYKVMKAAFKDLGDYAASLGVTFAIETGPEKAETLKKFLDDVNSAGVGVNMDPANLVMVTDDDPVRAVGILKDYIVHTHAKDGILIKKTDPKMIYDFFAEGGIEDLRMSDYFLEVPLGEGKVDFGGYLAALENIGYNGFLTVERECGENPYADIVKAVDFLDSMI